MLFFIIYFSFLSDAFKWIDADIQLKSYQQNKWIDEDQKH